MNPSARYKFKQPADAALVAVLAAAELAGTIHGGLPGSIPLLKDLARISRQLEECEEALDVVLAAAWKTGPHGRARCPRCHRRAPTAGNRIAAHASGSMWCSGSGAVLERGQAGT